LVSLREIRQYPSSLFSTNGYRVEAGAHDNLPQRLAEREWPVNAWCGTTVDTQARVKIAERAFRDVKAGVRWLSVEPMLERLTFTSLEMFNWIVIGGATKSTQTPAFDPPMEWVRHLLQQAHAAGIESVYAKANLRALRGYPQAAVGASDTEGDGAGDPPPQPPPTPTSTETVGPLDHRQTMRPGLPNFSVRSRAGVVS